MLYVASMDQEPDRDSHWVEAFRQAGCDVHTFATSTSVTGDAGMLGRARRRLHIGRDIRDLRRDLLDVVRKVEPDWVHFRLPLMFDKSTIKAIRDQGPLVTAYCNDDPFSPKRVKYLWRLYLSTIALFDVHFVYREHNVGDFTRRGARLVLHTPPCYVPWRHLPPSWERGEYEEYRSDAAFVGHWEADNRLACIDALVLAQFKVTLRGGMWDGACKAHPADRFGPVTNAFGDEYNKIYASAAAGLCFFSKVNRDQLTERALEIPAVGGLLVCERTDEIREVFQDREEAFFFSDIEELVRITRLVSKDEDLRLSVANAGRKRLLKGRHSVNVRVEEMLQFLGNHGLLNLESST
jgi:hypothetical protein